MDTKSKDHTLKEVFSMRESVRSYLATPVPHDLIEKILSLVISTVPTAGNLQSYKIIVIENSKKKEDLYLACHKQEQVLEAPVCLIFLADRSESMSKYRERGFYLYSVQDATNACMMTSLLCADEGLGTCWVGAFSDEKVSKIVGGDSSTLSPVAVLTVGYRKEEKHHTKHRKSLDKIVKFD